MNDLVNTPHGALSTLDAVTMDIQYHIKAAGSSMLRIGEGLIEAKKLVPHGQWLSYLRENFGWEERSAQYFMQMYSRFGKMAGLESIGKSKLLKMLSLPEGTEEAFVARHDIEHMTAREVGEAVKEARQEAGLAQPENQAHNNELGIPEEIADRMRELEKENRRLVQQNQDIVTANNGLRREKTELQGQLGEKEVMVAELQRAYNSLQGSITDKKSEEARGDAEREPADQLTAKAFTAAVRTFVGSCAMLPQMGRRLGAMSYEERMEYQEGLDTLETWMHGAMRAMLTPGGEVLECDG